MANFREVNRAIRINLSPKAPSAKPKDNRAEIIDGFEVWREGRKWHARKYPRAASASTKTALIKMIRG